jgi:serine/threonine protein kinase
MSELESDKIGKLINEYKLIKFLGKGKFSTVYQAECIKTGKLVAMKVIKVSKYYKVNL